MRVPLRFLSWHRVSHVVSFRVCVRPVVQIEPWELKVTVDIGCLALGLVYSHVEPLDVGQVTTCAAVLLKEPFRHYFAKI